MHQRGADTGFVALDVGDLGREGTASPGPLGTAGTPGLAGPPWRRGLLPGGAAGVGGRPSAGLRLRQMLRPRPLPPRLLSFLPPFLTAVLLTGGLLLHWRADLCGASVSGSGGRFAKLAASDPRLPRPSPPAAGTAGLHSLVVVAGHSVWTGRDLGRPEAEGAWAWEPYQARIPGQAESLLDHMRAGVAAVAGPPPEGGGGALLLFSGGATRLAAGPLTEAASYWLVSNGQAWFGTPAVRAVAFVEEYARDSMENVLFSLCRFRELTGRYPAGNLTLVSYSEKEARFRGLHAAALRWPAHRFAFLGSPAPPAAAAGMAAGEAATAALWGADPWGCGGELGAKRAARDPFGRAPPYLRGPSCPELADLLAFCGPGPFRGPLPWSPA